MTDRPANTSKGTELEQRIPSHYGRLTRWWYTRFPLKAKDVCIITGWKHLWRDADTGGPAGWGDVACAACGKQSYVESGR